MANQVAAMLLVEFISPEKRGYFSIMAASIDGLFNTFIALGYKYWQDWKRWFLFNDIEVFVVLILFAIFVTESPRYYISRNNFTKARNVFKRMAKTNRKEMFTQPLQGEDRTSLNFIHQRAASATSSQTSASPSSNRFVRLCKRSLYDRILIATVMFLWFAVDIVFYGIGFGINELSGDLYTNGIILGISDLISLICISCLVNIIGRKKSILLTWGLVSIGCIVYYFVSDYEYAAYAAVLIGRFGGSGTFQILYLYTSEAFPSQIRGTILGISNAMARVGGLIAPLLSSYVDHFMLVLGILGVVSFFISIILRETMGKKMEDKIEAVDDMRLVEEGAASYSQLD